MTLKNVEVLEQQTTHEKSWFQKFRNRATSTAVIASTAIVASTANAAGESVIPDFLKPAKDAISGLGVSLGEIFLIAIGITLVIITFTTSRGGIKKAG
ncbi:MULTISPECIES: hypothetical protein [unclassified Acinetobacter]|uniref:hypothetical protein n=1 Tax=unclassified Acinetobacter TaxID=196816 RepID=UPI001F4AA5DE|nr:MULTISPECIES: hypothetical protein [unclassified Acinetobacter]MCH7352242.1 hypothetical protein [Acinetobacter sp. NIPH 2023]MCH7358209.1 hypothetical protein [Acinetobacter sp. NIPH 2024]